MQDEWLNKLIAESAPHPPKLDFDNVRERLDKDDSPVCSQIDAVRQPHFGLVHIAAIAAAIVLVLGLSAVVLSLFSLSSVSDSAEESAAAQNTIENEYCQSACEAPNNNSSAETYDNAVTSTRFDEEENEVSDSDLTHDDEKDGDGKADEK